MEVKTRALSNDITLGWDHDGINVTGFEIEMGTVIGGPYPTKFTVPGATTRTYPIVNFWVTFTGNKYCFRAYAVNSTMKSAPSNEACCTRPTTTTTSVIPTTTTTSIPTTTSSIPTTTTTSIHVPTAPTNIRIY